MPRTLGGSEGDVHTPGWPSRPPEHIVVAIHAWTVCLTLLIREETRPLPRLSQCPLNVTVYNNHREGQ